MGPSAFEGYIFPSMPSIWTVTGGNQLLSLHCFASVQLAHGYVSQSNSTKKQCFSIVVFGVGLVFFVWATVTLSKTLGNARAHFTTGFWRFGGVPNSIRYQYWFRGDQIHQTLVAGFDVEFLSHPLTFYGGLWVDITQLSHIKISIIFHRFAMTHFPIRMFRWVETIESRIFVQIRAGNWTCVAQIVRISHDINFTRLWIKDAFMKKQWYPMISQYPMISHDASPLYRAETIQPVIARVAFFKHRRRTTRGAPRPVSL